MNQDPLIPFVPNTKYRVVKRFVCDKIVFEKDQVLLFVSYREFPKDGFEICTFRTEDRRKIEWVYHSEFKSHFVKVD